MFAWRTPSAHTFFVHFLSTFEKNECHLGRYNEEVFENAHILNKKLLHVAVFPAPTHVLQQTNELKLNRSEDVELKEHS